MARDSEKRIDEVLDWLDLARVRDTVAGDLPYGAQKTLGMAISLMAAPKLLMLDEPVAGLSAAEADNVRDTIKKVRDRGISVVVIDHNMRFMAGLCDRILVLHHGQELAHGVAAGRAARSEGHRGVSGAQLCQGLSCAMSACATAVSSAPTTSRSMLEPGRTVALVGSNGAGKSSTLKAIMGLAAYPSGDILLEGRSIKQVQTSTSCAPGSATRPKAGASSPP